MLPNRLQHLHQTMVLALPTHEDNNYTMLVVGSTVANCATMSMQWLSQEEVSAKLAALQPDDCDGGVFAVDPPSSVRYRREQGNSSPYGQFLDCYRRSLAHNGYVCPDDVAQRLYDHFKSVSDVPSIASAYTASRDGGAEWSACAQSSADFPHALLVVPTLVARFAGRHALAKSVRDAARVFQQNRIVDAACGLLSALLERCALSKCSPLDAMLHFSNKHTGGKMLSEYEGNLLSSAMSDTLLSFIKDIRDIVNMHPSLAAGDGCSEDEQKVADTVALILINELVAGGGGQGGSAAILLDNAPLSSAQRLFWSQAKQVAKAANRPSAELADLSINDACSLFGTGSEAASEYQGTPSSTSIRNDSYTCYCCRCGHMRAIYFAKVYKFPGCCIC
jgi:hypothetical protein